jgi:hypothetical protein
MGAPGVCDALRHAAQRTAGVPPTGTCHINTTTSDTTPHPLPSPTPHTTRGTHGRSGQQGGGAHIWREQGDRASSRQPSAVWASGSRRSERCVACGVWRPPSPPVLVVRVLRHRLHGAAWSLLPPLCCCWCTQHASCPARPRAQPVAGGGRAGGQQGRSAGQLAGPACGRDPRQGGQHHAQSGARA